MKKIVFILILSLCSPILKAQWDTERILTIGQHAMGYNDYILSIQYFNQAIKVKPHLSDPYIYRGFAKIHLGDLQGALNDLNIAIESNPFLPYAYYVRGVAHYRLQQYQNSSEDFAKALEFNPNNKDLMLLKIESLQQSEKYQDAFNELTTYIKLWPKEKSMLLYKSILLLSIKDTTNAIREIDHYIKDDSLNSKAYSIRAFIHMKQNKANEAYNDYSRAIQLNSKSPEDYVNRAYFNIQKRKYRLAMEDYNTAIKYDSESVLAHYNRAMLRAKVGDYNNALYDFKFTIERDSSNYEALLQKAEIESRLGNFIQAITDYKTIIRKYNFFTPAYEEIIKAYSRLRMEKEAFTYQMELEKIEKSRESLSKKNKKSLAGGTSNVATTTSKATLFDNHTKARNFDELFNQLAKKTEIKEQDEASVELYENNNIRGTIQNRNVKIDDEKDFFLTFYVKTEELRRTNTYYPILDQYNLSQKYSIRLKLSNKPFPLTEEIINYHFKSIESLTDSINRFPTSNFYFRRAIDYFLVLDYQNAFDDFSKAIEKDKSFAFAYFGRACSQQKLIELERISNSKELTMTQINQRKNEILADLDKVITLCPDFSFAYYNKANLLCSMGQFQNAIEAYSLAIGFDNDFAEAYFNRGLTYVFISNAAKARTDLSKAGELGIYNSYNLIKRLN